MVTSDHTVGTSDHMVGTSDHTVGTSDHKVGTSDHTVGTSDHMVGTSDDKVYLTFHIMAVTQQKTVDPYPYYKSLQLGNNFVLP